MNSGRNGITSVKPVYPRKLAAVTANTLRRQAASERGGLGCWVLGDGCWVPGAVCAEVRPVPGSASCPLAAVGCFGGGAKIPLYVSSSCHSLCSVTERLCTRHTAPSTSHSAP